MGAACEGGAGGGVDRLSCRSGRRFRLHEEVHARRRYLPSRDEELHKLVQDGLEKGFLTYDEIVVGLDDVELNKEQIEDFYTYLIDHGVELMEGEQHKRPHEEPEPEEEKVSPKLDLTVEPSLDSLRLYLREIGKVPLLGQTRSRSRSGSSGRHVGQDADDRGEPAPRRLDREVYLGQGLGFLDLIQEVARPHPRGSRSSTTARASSSRPTRHGGSARR